MFVPVSLRMSCSLSLLSDTAAATSSKYLRGAVWMLEECVGSLSCQVTPGSDVVPAAEEEEEEEEWDEALFDFPGQTAEDLSFQKGALIRVTEHIDAEWRRGRVDGKEGLYPAAFTQPSLRPPPAGGGSLRSYPPRFRFPLQVGDIVTQVESVDEQWIVGVPAMLPSVQTVTPGSDVAPAAEEEEEEEEEWDEALFDFPGQTAEDLSFQKGALIWVTEHIDAEWRRGRVDGKEGLYPAAFTQPSLRPPPASGGSARAVFDFTAENQDELTLKVGDIVTQVESVDEQWIVGVVAGKRGIVPKNYISLL
uniref:SH3 domain-containing protein n=1 Tax=Salarias fasciatus TaxID=181472 RepID=A0A672JDC1_SALFA